MLVCVDHLGHLEQKALVVKNQVAQHGEEHGVIRGVGKHVGEVEGEERAEKVGRQLERERAEVAAAASPKRGPAFLYYWYW